jgi:glucose/arabinose dehydrogenase
MNHPKGNTMRNILVIATVGVALALAACGSSGAKPATTTQPPATTAPTTAAPSTTAAPAEPKQGVVPNVVGKDLQLAQDTMQAAGYFNLDSRDTTGQGRQQILDRNWKVCKQSVPPGAKVVPGELIVLDAVKQDESCP